MKLFNRNYETVGNEKSDFCIITRGQLRVKWGNKFIDLIKDGKLNLDADYDIINRINEYSDINTNNDGIYVTESGEIYIVSNKVIIPIRSSVEDSEYVAYLKQSKDGSSKETAQLNIGLCFKTKSELEQSGMKNGISYIIDEKILYLINNNEYIPLKLEIENPFTKPFEIKLSNNNSFALFLNGYFSSNGTKIIIGTEDNNISIYSESDSSFIECVSDLNIRVSDKDVITVKNDSVNINNSDLVINNGKSVRCDIYKSLNGSKTKELYIDKGDIYCDNIYIRNGIKYGEIVNYEKLKELSDSNSLSSNSVYYLSDYQDPFNIIDSFYNDEYSESESEDDTPVLLNKKNVFELELKTTNDGKLSKNGRINEFNCDITYDISYNDNICTIEDKYTDEETGEEIIEEINIKAKGVITGMEDEYGNYAPFNFKNKQFLIDGEWKYCFGGDEDKSLNGVFENIKIYGDFFDFRHDQMPNSYNYNGFIGGNGIICINSNSATDSSISGIKDRMIINSENFKRNKINSEIISNISINGNFLDNNISLESFINTNINGECKQSTINGVINNCSIPGMKNITSSSGFENMIFSNQLNNSNFHSLIKDIDLSTVANNGHLYTDKYVDVFYDSTGGMKIIYIPDILPFYGQIVMFSGTVDKIPNGWKICDGNNGTPNLINKFILASDVSGNEGGNNKISYKNLPQHEHSLTFTHRIPGSSIGSKLYSKDNGDIIDCRNEISSPGNDKTAYVKTGYSQILLYSNEFEAPTQGIPTNNNVNIRWQQENDSGDKHKFWKRDNSGFVNISDFTNAIKDYLSVGGSINYTQEDFIPKYYSLIFIMYTGE